MTQAVHLQLGTARARLDDGTPRVEAGRDLQCALTTPDPSLSRRHAELFLHEGDAFIRDLGSANGTWIDGQRLAADPVKLQAGQVVHLGSVPLGIRWE